MIRNRRPDERIRFPSCFKFCSFFYVYDPIGATPTLLGFTSGVALPPVPGRSLILLVSMNGAVVGGLRRQQRLV
ncbi:hypothetical protein NDU88_003500 [Pleurodeles waltl]|uniref:Uncharacterized protein n=1 Tax=Pleurodeles waltl TaxID=8319 RepID=A0AAV7KV42_PLEWA|nr:hypothetical protein NDU88_003500 [Pleurodeles waltl]